MLHEETVAVELILIAVAGVTVMLSLFVFLLIVAETMPPTSDAVPLIGQSNHLLLHPRPDVPLIHGRSRLLKSGPTM